MSTALEKCKKKLLYCLFWYKVFDLWKLQLLSISWWIPSWTLINIWKTNARIFCIGLNKEQSIHTDCFFSFFFSKFNCRIKDWPTLPYVDNSRSVTHKPPYTSPPTAILKSLITIFIRISAQPRISAHLEWAPIPKAEKVNKRPPPPPPNQTQISAHPYPTHLSK